MKHMGKILFGHHPADAHPGLLLIGLGQVEADHPELNQDFMGHFGTLGFHGDLL
jgi:hypothetical protein